MRYLLTALLAFSAFAGCTSQASKEVPSAIPAKSHAGHNMHGVKSQLVIETNPSPPNADAPTKLTLMIHDAEGAMVREFDEIHEREIHLIVVRDGLDIFAHVHPDISPTGAITVTHTFPTPGRYLIYADHKPRGGAPSTPMASIQVAGDPPPAPKLTPDAPGTIVADMLQAKIGVSRAQAGQETPILFNLFDENGRPLNDLEPYLGAMGHLVILSADGEQFVHAHPDAASAKSNQVAFGAHFPSVGFYKGWGQFQRSGTVRTIPFVIDVK